jgi:hypothetical protein
MVGAVSLKKTDRNENIFQTNFEKKFQMFNGRLTFFVDPDTHLAKEAILVRLLRSVLVTLSVEGANSDFLPAI